MRKIFVAILILVSINALAQNTPYNISKDPKNDELTFNGPINFNDLEKESSFTWLKSGTDEYRPDEQLVNVLKRQLHDYTMVVFLGTWCDDSHYLIPKLEKILQITGYPSTRLTMFGVNREKTTKGGEEKKYNITLVPTIILFNNDGKEMGRITESVQKSIEADLCAMLPH